MTEHRQLLELYRQSRDALHKPSKRIRMIWAADQFIKIHPQYWQIDIYHKLERIFAQP